MPGSPPRPRASSTVQQRRDQPTRDAATGRCRNQSEHRISPKNSTASEAYWSSDGERGVRYSAPMQTSATVPSKAMVPSSDVHRVVFVASGGKVVNSAASSASVTSSPSANT